MNDNGLQPPRWADRLLRWLCAEEHLEILLGDLHELFEHRYETQGKTRARLHYIKDAFDMLRPFALKKGKSKLKISQIDMFSNYLKIGWRNMKRYKSYSTINVLGLALGLAACLLLYRFVVDELSYDSFHEKKDRIYRVVFSTNDDKSPSNANGSFGPAPAMARDFPEVENYARFKMVQRGAKLLVKQGDQRFYEDRFFFADSTIFEVFTHKMLRGNAKTALKELNTVVLTESTARKYFGESDPMGEVITVDPYNDGKEMDLMVTGVVEDVPSNAHIHFDLLASFHSQREPTTAWGGFWQVFSYVLLKENASSTTVDERLIDYPLQQMGEGNNWYDLSLQPLTDIHLYSSLKSEIEPNSSITKVYVFSAVGLLILTIACINFLTLSTAKSARRAREVGVRKTFGAHRSQLFYQFVSEAMLHGVIATVIALGLVYYAMPFVNQLTGKSMSLFQNGWWEPILLALASILVVTFMAGLYPAIFLSSFKPVVVLKSKATGKGAIAGLRKALVVFQFTVSIGLIIGALIVQSQMNLVHEKSTAQAGNQVLVLQLNNELRENLEAFQNQLDQIPTVQHYAGSSRVPTKGSSTSCFEVTEDRSGCGFMYLVDHDYPEVMNYKLLAGRYFNPDIATDMYGGYIISESAVKEFGFGSPEAALGQEFGDEGIAETRIIGVIEDFHVYSLHRSLESAYMLVTPKEYFNYVSINVEAGQLSTTLSQIGTAWAKFSTEAPFDYFFLDNAFQQLHSNDIRTGKVVTVLTILAMIIAATGLFGLASFTTEQKAKEIGIRKVLGASLGSLLKLMSKSYFKLILIAVAIGLPLSFWLMSQWLSSFAYRVEIQPLVFIIATVIVMTIVALSVGYQSIKVALANPVNSLRDE